MHCPFGSDLDTKVIDSRLVAEGDAVRRRRECLSCGERFTPFETAELVMPHLITRAGRREPVDADKIRSGLSHAFATPTAKVYEDETPLHLHQTHERPVAARE